jgi:creatinine amidohydrolase
MLTWLNTAWDFKADLPKVALLPLACVETHGPHLPIGTDTIILTEIARRVANRLVANTFLLPTWPLGTSVRHAGEPGTIYLHFETLWAVVRDVVTSLHQHGIHQVAVLNNHGSPLTSMSRPLGNFVVKTAVRQLNYETPGLAAIWVQPFAAARTSLAKLFNLARDEVHAGSIETAMLMYLAPDLVGALPPDEVPSVSVSHFELMRFKQLAPGGVWGRPSHSSAEKGAQALELAVNATVEYIEGTFRQIADLKEASANRQSGAQPCEVRAQD